MNCVAYPHQAFCRCGAAIAPRSDALCDACAESLIADITALQERVRELEEANKRMYDISMKNDHEFGLTLQFANKTIEQEKCIAALREQLIKLNDTSVVWHRFPDKMPDSRKEYLCHRDGFTHLWWWLDKISGFDVNPTNNPINSGKQPQWWAEVPRPGKED